MDLRTVDTPEGLEARLVVLRKMARPGVRRAVVCPLPDDRCNWRSFDEGATCPQHGGARVQANRPYLGVPTS